MKSHRLARFIDRTLVRLAEGLGYEVRPIERSQLLQPIPPGARLYVGCGEDQLEGYLGCDLRPLPHVALAAKAWEVSRHCTGLSEIYTRHMLEHLTLAEVRQTLRDWRLALADDGLLRIEVPNLDFMIDKWQSAQWNESSLSEKFSEATWGMAGLFGWQRECDPSAPDYAPSYWDVHKMGFNRQSMQYFLEEAGFTEIEVWCEGFTPEQIERRGLSPEECRDCHLMATARKQAIAQSQAA